MCQGNRVSFSRGQKTRAVFPFLRQFYFACKAFRVGLCCVCASPGMCSGITAPGRISKALLQCK